MTKSVNKVILIGNLGRDPETRQTANGGSVSNASLATSDKRKDKVTQEEIVKVDWHRLVFFGKLSEIVATYLRKGSKIYVEGRISYRKWTDKEGKDRFSTDIVVNELSMLDSKSNTNNEEGVDGNNTIVDDTIPF